jgi:hypothetical protein
MDFIKLAKDKYLHGATLNTKKITLKQVNAAIDKVHPKVFLVKDKNYFFIASDDEQMGLKIAGLYQASIYVSRLNELPIERWVSEVTKLLESTR